MKNSLLLLLLLFTGASVAQAYQGPNCPQTLNISTGYDQNTSSLIPDGDPDDDWIVAQTPPAESAFLGLQAMVIPKSPAYDWAGSTSKFINFQNSKNGPNNWCGPYPFVYLNGFCICGPGEDPVDVTFDLNLHGDDWAEVVLLDGNGDTIQTLLSQEHKHTLTNFQNPTDQASVTLALQPGPYSLALVHRNKTSIMGVSLDGTITVAEPGGVLNGSECGFDPPVLNGSLTGPSKTSCGQGNGSGCPEDLNISTGYDQSTASLIADNQRDDDWILTQVPVGTSSSNVGQEGFITPKHPSYHWAGSTSKYMNYHNATSGPNNWYNSTLPFVYQNGFCLCGDLTEEVDVTFNLSLHCDNWAEVWLMDGNGNAIQLLLTQTHQQIVANFRNPTDDTTITIGLQPGKYSLALLQRNGSGPTAVSLDGTISTQPNGLLNGDECEFTPDLNGTFNGSTVTQQGGSFKKSDNSGNGINTDYLHEAAVYPNPAQNTIHLKGFGEDTKLVLMDMRGRVIMDKIVDSANAIDISDIIPGTYLIRVSDAAGHSLTETMIIE